jgi:predicted nucleic acid-binding protein
MASGPKTIIFDSSGLVSLVKADDQLHERAVKVEALLSEEGWRVILPYEVLAEALNTIGKLVHKRSALLVGNALMEQYADQALSLFPSEPHIVARALEQLGQATGDHRLSTAEASLARSD